MKLLILISSALSMTANCRRVFIIYPNVAEKRLANENFREVHAYASSLPLFTINMCPSGQMAYRGKSKYDWFCDCAPGYIYRPSFNKCYPVYRQGPCNKDEHLVFKTDRKIPVCVTNPCKEGSFRYNGQCYHLNSDCPSGDCARLEKYTIFKVPRNCPPGSRRDSRNRCRENFNV